MSGKILVGVRHGIPSSYNKGCRCDECRECNRLRHKAFTEKYKDREPYEHGDSAYSNWGCRCDICKAAHSERMREYWSNISQKDA